LRQHAGADRPTSGGSFQARGLQMTLLSATAGDGTGPVIGATFGLLALASAGMLFLNQIADGDNVCFADRIVPPPKDDRDYRYVEMDNGLRALLVSDPDADTSAAAMSVHVGSLSDPEESPGLAHFLEHMLFTGNKKYPKPSEYFNFIKNHGGSANAATGLEVTNFHFVVPPSNFLDSLERLLQFFVAPTFEKSMVNKEKHAVSSEHSKNIAQDEWRFQRLRRLTTGNPRCPLGNFMTGNLVTLANASTLELTSFWASEYTPNRMALAVVASEALDVLEAKVRGLVAHIPSGRKHPATFGEQPGPVAPSQALWPGGNVSAGGVAAGGRRIDFVPAGDVDALRLLWYMPAIEGEYNKKSMSYITTLLGDEGPGSILSELRAHRGWAHALTAGASREATFFVHVGISVTLTQEGKEHIAEIVEIIFAYLRLVTKTGAERWRWEEEANLTSIAWRYLEPPDAQSLAQALAETLALGACPVCDLLRAAYVYREFDRRQIADILDHLTPDTMLLYVCSRDLAAEASRASPMRTVRSGDDAGVAEQTGEWLTEEYYGIHYRVTELQADHVVRWKSADAERLNLTLSLPPRNPYIPTDFDRKSAPRSMARDDEEGQPRPRIAKSTALERIWLHTDSIFEQPRGVITCTIASPGVSADARTLWTTQLLVNLAMDALNEEAYQASVAGLSARVGVGIEGLELSAAGYSQHLITVLALAASALGTQGSNSSPNRTRVPPTGAVQRSFSRQRFGRVKAALAQDLRAAQFAGALQTALVHLKLAVRTQTAFYDRLSGVDIVEALRPEEVSAHAQTLFDQGSFTECLLNGNLGPEDASAISTELRKHLGNASLSKADLSALRQSVLSVPLGSTVYALDALDPAERNSAVVLYYEVGTTVGPRGIRDVACLELLELMVQQKAFDQLRTKEQLGYTVGLNSYRAWAAQAIVIYARSDLASADYLDERAEAFIQSHLTELNATSDEHFENDKQALLHSLAVRDADLDAQTSRMWQEFEMHECNFHRTAQVQDEVQSLTKADIVDMYRRTFVDAASRRKLSVWVRAPGEDGRETPRRKAGARPLAGVDHVLTPDRLHAWRADRDVLPNADDTLPCQAYEAHEGRTRT